MCVVCVYKKHVFQIFFSCFLLISSLLVRAVNPRPVGMYIYYNPHNEANLRGVGERQISGSQWLRADLKPVEDVILSFFFVDFSPNF